MSEDPTRQFRNGDLKIIRERLDSIDSRLGTLEERVERRLMETRPIWETVLQQLSDMQEQLKDMQAQLKEMNARQSRFENENKDLRRMFRAAFSDLSRVQEDLEERMDRLEERTVPQ